MCTRLQLENLTRAMVKEYRKVYGDKIEGIYLFGSYARGDASSESDVDIVAIVHGERLNLQQLLCMVWDASAEIGIENDVVVSPGVIPFDEFERFKGIHPYYINIAKEGIRVG